MTRRDASLITVAAGLFVLAFPPFNLLAPSFLCLVPVVWLIHSGARDPRPVRRHLEQGFWFGLLGYGVLLHWIAVALWRHRPGWLLGYAFVIGALAICTAGTFAFIGWARRETGLSLLLIFPPVWTAAEWSIAHLGGLRFPWLGLGTSLTGFPFLVQIADIVGARGVTLLLAAANTALAMAWLQRRQPRRANTLVLSVVAGLAMALGYSFHRTRTLETRRVGIVALVQPDTPVRDKWNPTVHDSILADVLDLSRSAARSARPDLIVWPETAVPGYLPSHPDWEALVAEHARRTGVPVLVGAMDREQGQSGDDRLYNAAFLFDPDGRRDRQPPYHKQYPVLLVERGALRGSAGVSRGAIGPILTAPIGRFGVLICYESAFEDVARGYARRGAEFLVNIANDGWFSRTSEPAQHAAHVVMRAIENRRGIARAANSGASELVDPFGRILRRSVLDRRTFVVGELFTSDTITVYARLGDWVGLLCTVLAVALACHAVLRRPLHFSALR